MKEEFIKYFNDRLLETKMGCIYDIFRKYHGEEHVDLIPDIENVDIESIIDKGIFEKFSKEKMQKILDEVCNRIISSKIIIWYPELTIKNELNKSHVIKDLYVRIVVTKEGCLVGFPTYLKATYTTAELRSGYLHSHTPRISSPRGLTTWSRVCFGSGPINNTMASITNRYSELWNLFCMELDMSVHTESLAGVPYVGMSSITDKKLTIARLGIINANITSTKEDIIKEFLPYLIQHMDIKFSFSGGFNLGIGIYEAILKISDIYIQWVNEDRTIKTPQDLDEYKNLLDTYILDNGILYLESEHGGMYAFLEMQGTDILTFKNNKIKIKIFESLSSAQNKVTLLADIYFTRIIFTMLIIMNYRYGNTDNNATTDGPEETVIYI